MITTIKIQKETKDRMTSLDLAEKGKTFDMIVNDLITSYLSISKKHRKDYREWEKSMKAHKRGEKDYEKEVKDYERKKVEYNKQRQVWKKLLSWAKSKGFKE